MAKTIIIGGVAGGASCAARLRRLDETAEIVLIERGEHISFANCGLPYHVGNVIRSERSLLLLSPQVMRARFRVDVRVHSEVVRIDRAAKCVTVRQEDGSAYTETYDTLVIATGSSPLRPPIPGINSSRVQTLWTVGDAKRIREIAMRGSMRSATVVGGGFIGLEMAENLKSAGLSVVLAEAASQLLPPLDIEMSLPLKKHLLDNGIDVRLGDGVQSFQETDNGILTSLASGARIESDLVVLSIGVSPNSELAKAAGLSINARGGIVTDSHLRTSDPSIYAVGDVIEVDEPVLGGKTMVPLAGPANKQGRIAADNIAGGDEVYAGTQGTSIAKIFEMTAASTGMNEKTLVARGMRKTVDYDSVTIVQNHHAGYYPGAKPMTLKLLFTPDGSRILGAQIVGYDGVDKRIDVLATALRLGATVRQLRELELAYAPPYSSAKDPVNMLGYAAENVVNGLTAFAEWNVFDKQSKPIALDVREKAEVDAFALPGAIAIPLGELRERLDELPGDSPIVVLCGIGVRAHTAVRLLQQSGRPAASVYPGGMYFYRLTHI